MARLGGSMLRGRAHESQAWANGQAQTGTAESFDLARAVVPGPQQAPSFQTPLTGEVLVNTSTVGDQDSATVTALASGYVVSWREGSGDDVKIRFYDNAGNPVSGEIVVNNSSVLAMAGIKLAALTGGGFVATWQSGQAGDFDIVAQRFDASGNEVGGEFTVNTIVVGSQIDPQITGLAGGGFVVSWTRNVSSPDFDVKAQIYNAAGVPVGGEFQVNPPSTSTQLASSLGATPDGGFIALFDAKNSVSSDTFNVWFQRFDAIGNTVGSATRVNTIASFGQLGADIAVLNDGSFVVTWALQRSVDSANGYDVMARRFDANGVAAAGGEFLVDTVAHRGALGTSVTALDNGYYLVTYAGWVQTGPDAPTVPEGRRPTMGRLYGPNDQPAGDPFEISNTGTGGHAALLNDPANSVVVVFSSDAVAAPEDVFMRRYLTGTPSDATPPIVGTPDPDTLVGTAGADVIQGLADNDFLNGGGAPDHMEGGLGDDVYRVDNAADAAIEAAGEGNDTVAADVSYVLVEDSEIEALTTTNAAGTAAINLTGNRLGNSIYGNAGDNVLDGRAGDDLLVGQEGNDLLIGGSGNDAMRGGAGNDIYRITEGLDIVIENAGEGDDTVQASISYQLADGASVETLTVVVQSATTAIDLIGNEVGQSIFGNAGNNYLNGGGGDDQLTGNEGNDILEGAAGADVMRGNIGNDVYRVQDGLDTLFESLGQGNDILAASTSYTLGAGLSIETMIVLVQSTTDAIDLTGNEIAQSINGNDGANVLDGRLGVDLLRGYGGADTFQFTTAHGAGNMDVIADFLTGVDRIALDNAIFTVLAEGALPAGAFVIGSAALDADDRIIYNQTTGQLFYDADGNGGAAPASLFATLSGAPLLAASDFTVI